MQLNLQSPFKTLNKAYLKEKVSRNNIELFKQQLTLLFGKAETGQSEDTLKDFITEFLRNTWYNPNHAITINKERKDLSIHTGKTAKDKVGVIAEIKKTGSPEMITADKPNVKAFHELVLYYLQERNSTPANNEIKYLLATDVNNWILIDANEFDKKIYRNGKIKKLYEIFVNDQKDNPFFYGELKRILDETNETITCTQFNLNSYKKYISNTDKTDDEKLIPLYKMLSPAHVLKLPFTNDSNSLDKNFYAELLHMVGLEEIKEGSKKLIQRKKESSDASLLENAIIKLQDRDCLRYVPDVTKFGFTKDEQYYSIALELCITWINRILFLKLLEAQLYSYHQKNTEYLFLNDHFIHDFDELNNLFLQVLAERPDNRRERLKSKFSKVPYLNSSLFERTELERKTIDISALDNNLPLPLYSSTVLKDNSKRKQGSLNTLNYLFTFLNSYDFASEGKAEIQEENKNLINASVLGLIFEKINGYKDGSFFTPGFITMYMCRETLRRAAVQKFNEVNNWNHATFENLQEAIEYADKEKRQQANAIINSITICDPAVGSGHFLVSALNELISIKHDLKILQYHHNGQRINHKEYKIDIENDELIIQDIETEDFFKYTLNQKGNIKPELQWLQETLFHEKETLIENCLFGVDINSNSVKICRLRLWIELLKNAYYTKESNYAELETLPNIDINIKQGNSLISRFALDADLSGTLKKSKWNIDSYKIAVQTYRNAQSKEEKHEMEELIDTIKKDFKTDVATYDPINKKLSKLRGELALLQRTDLFSTEAKKKSKANKELEKLSAAIDKLNKEKDDILSSVIYKDAFEWRFEFPEILNSDGKFLGFDVVIGNPPYVTGSNVKSAKKLYIESYKTAQYQFDLYVLFIERADTIIKNRGHISLITPNSWLKNLMMSECRKYILEKLNCFSINPNISNAFEEASVDTLIFISQKKEYGQEEQNQTAVWNFIQKEPNLKRVISQARFENNDGFVFDLEVDDDKHKIIQKIKNNSSQLEKFFEITRGINPYDSYTGQSKEIIESKAYHSDTKKDETFVPELRGKHLFKYGYTWDKKHFISYGDWLAAPRNERFFRGKRILFREILGEKNFICTVVEEEFKNDRSLYIALPREDINIYFIQALLASKLLAWYFRHEKNEFDSLFPKIRVEEFKKLPIKNSSSQPPFITLVDKILSAKKENPQAVTTIWEKEIDALVYKLYELTEEEIKLVEGNA